MFRAFRVRGLGFGVHALPVDPHLNFTPNRPKPLRFQSKGLLQGTGRGALLIENRPVEALSISYLEVRRLS